MVSTTHSFDRRFLAVGVATPVRPYSLVIPVSITPMPYMMPPGEAAVTPAPADRTETSCGQSVVVLQHPGRNGGGRLL